MLRFDVKPRDEESFFIDVEQKDNVFQGFYSVLTENYDDVPSINLFVLDPDGKIAHSKMNRAIG